MRSKTLHLDDRSELGADRFNRPEHGFRQEQRRAFLTLRPGYPAKSTGRSASAVSTSTPSCALTRSSRVMSRRNIPRAATTTSVARTGWVRPHAWSRTAAPRRWTASSSGRSPGSGTAEVQLERHSDGAGRSPQRPTGARPCGPESRCAGAGRDRSWHATALGRHGRFRRAWAQRYEDHAVHPM